MVFSSLLFIFIFLPVFLVIYYLAPRKARNLVALLGSYFFYAWGAPLFAFVLFGTTLINYFFGKLIYYYTKHHDFVIPTEAKRSGGIFLKTDKPSWTNNRNSDITTEKDSSTTPVGSGRNDKMKRVVMIIAIILNVGLLFYFKYANFFVDEINALIGLLGAQTLSWTSVVLPIGISFFTFHEISYLVDVYRGVVSPAQSFSQFALYIVLFPQLIAGPIIRYHDIADQLKERIYASEKFLEGIWRFCLGLGKKVLLANSLGQVADAVFVLSDGALTTPYAWLGILAYTMQIYFDFSGYSDMAIGLGKMMGFEFLENFNLPYISRTFTEFWTRWHISLSRWMKEYLYIPLGGNRISARRTVINLWLVFLLSGFWHGASLNFIFWGLYHGFFISLDKIGWKKVADRLPGLIIIPLNFVLIMIGWVFFRSASMDQAFSYLLRLFSITKPDSAVHVLWPDVIGYRGILVLCVAVVISFLPAILSFRAHSTRLRVNSAAGVVEKSFREGALSEKDSSTSLLTVASVGMTKIVFLKFGIAVALFALSAATLANASFNPFIYFRF